MNGEPKHFFEFDAFLVDVGERRLFRNGESVALTSKGFDILLALVENSGHTVDKEDLMQAVWKDTFVEEGNLNRHISTLRRLLGDSRREQKFIKTIPKHGYRFTNIVRKSVGSAAVMPADYKLTSTPAVDGSAPGGFWTFTRITIAACLVLVGIVFTAWSLSRTSRADNKTGTATQNAGAAAAYKRGRELWNTRGAENLHESTLLLERSVREDPNFALAHAALADAYAFDYTYWKKAENEANTAITLDPSLGQPHASIGFVKMYWQWDLSAAETEFKKAVSLSPDYATGHQWYSLNLAASGHVDAALVEIKQAVDLEPASVAINADYCQVLYFARRYEDASRQCQKVLKMNPECNAAHLLIYDIYLALGKDDEAVNEFFENKALYEGEMTAAAVDALRRAYGEGGIQGFYKEQLKFFAHVPQNSYKLAQTYARLGDDDTAFIELKKAYEQSNFDLILMNADPVFRTMREQARFQELARTLSKSI